MASDASNNMYDVAVVGATGAVGEDPRLHPVLRRRACSASHGTCATLRQPRSNPEVVVRTSHRVRTRCRSQSVQTAWQHPSVCRSRSRCFPFSAT